MVAPLDPSVPMLTPAAVYAPRARDLLRHLERALAAWQFVDDTAAASVEAMAKDMLWRRGKTFGELTRDAQEPAIALLSPTAMKRAGVDPDGPITIGVDAHSESFVVRTRLVDRAAFIKWLRGRSEPQTTVTIASEAVFVMRGTTDWPVACVARRDNAYCQFGSGAARQPLAPLRAWLNGQSPKSQRQEHRAGISLLRDSDVYLLLGSNGVVDLLESGMRASAARRARFSEGPNHRKAKKYRGARGIRMLRRLASHFSTIAIGLRRTPTIALDAALLPRRKAFLSSLRRVATPANAQIYQWAKSPALVQAFIHSDGKVASALLGAMGVSLPKKVLNGSIAALAFGVDAATGAAKKDQRVQPASFAYMFPCAITVGLNPGHALAVHQSLRKSLALRATEAGPVWPRSNWPVLAGSSKHGDFELDVSEPSKHVGGSVTFSAGPGSGDAARRRLRKVIVKQGHDPVPMLFGAIDLRAVDAAFGGQQLASEHKPFLLMVDALRARVQPALTKLGRLELKAELRDHHIAISLASDG